VAVYAGAIDGPDGSGCEEMDLQPSELLTERGVHLYLCRASKIGLFVSE
jgi:hypothetical protein